MNRTVNAWFGAKSRVPVRAKGVLSEEEKGVSTST